MPKLTQAKIDYINVKYALALKGYTLTKVAKELKLCGPQSVQMVLQGRYTSKRVSAHISKIING